MAATLSWGILGTGRIARTFAEAMATSRTGRLAAVASRARSPADEFAKTFGIAGAYGSYAELLEDSAVQAVYISPPHPFHASHAAGLQPPRTGAPTMSTATRKPALGSAEALVTALCDARTAAVTPRADSRGLAQANMRRQLAADGLKPAA